ncbi:fumarylacetoacetate hydrolase family protein [Pseudarthrobacter sp. SL88]|uniref:fumarylacetoacetate hydrolase family protein n=1 Tax=Pseudarthrobacter sp. SL88 TaxID=2994666 RepID=UPI002275E29B|nr:fumarylacetoacetate hydrolase family protein [Pseudarthrobacter sp. SL88]MCY1674946.1 fumarylacetoacetate hydrolase family protein [Pseudarthrobacter sp. SL88]
MSDSPVGLAEGSFGVARLRNSEGEFPAIVRPDGTVLDLSTQYIDTHAVFADWNQAFARLFDLAGSPAVTGEYASYRALPPLAHPNLMGAGQNFKTHTAQMLTKNKFNQHKRLPGETDEVFYARNLELMEERSRTGVPFFWTGLHSSLAGAGDDLVLPLIGEQPDWELELCVVVGETRRFVCPEEADSAIAGYMIMNDIGTPDNFRRTDIHFGFDWIGKHQPTFKIAGPFVVPKEFVDPAKVQIQLDLNGTRMQDWPAGDMIFSPQQFVTYASERVNLMPGDHIFLGSAPGNGAHHNRFLRPGDIIDASLTGLGRQRNLCVAEDTNGRTPVYPSYPSD